MAVCSGPSVLRVKKKYKLNVYLEASHLFVIFFLKFRERRKWMQCKVDIFEQCKIAIMVIN